MCLAEHLLYLVAYSCSLLKCIKIIYGVNANEIVAREASQEVNIDELLLTVSIAPDGTLIGLNGVPIAVPTSPSESNSNYNNSGVILADPVLSRSGGGSMSRGSHHDQEEILFPPQFLQVF